MKKLLFFLLISLPLISSAELIITVPCQPANQYTQDQTCIFDRDAGGHFVNLKWKIDKSFTNPSCSLGCIDGQGKICASIFSSITTANQITIPGGTTDRALAPQGNVSLEYPNYGTVYQASCCNRKSDGAIDTANCAKSPKMTIVNSAPTAKVKSKYIEAQFKDNGVNVALISGPDVKTKTVNYYSRPYEAPFVEDKTPDSAGYYTARLLTGNNSILNHYGVADPYGVDIYMPKSCFTGSGNFDTDKCGVTPGLILQFPCRPEAKAITLIENKTKSEAVRVQLNLSNNACD